MQDEKLENLILSQEQELAIQTAKSNINLLLTGGAGVGKSITLDKIIYELKKEGRNVLVCAPTGIAAQHIGGATIHSTFKVPIKFDTEKLDPKYAYSRFIGERNEPFKKLLLATDTLIIDEVSMLRADVFDYVCNTLNAINEISKKELHKSHICQMILCGDFCQLPPVVKEDEELKYLTCHYPNNKKMYAFNTDNWKKLNLKTIVLHEIFRQSNADFANALNMIRFGDVNGLRYIIDNSNKNVDKEAINICTINKAAEEKNEIEINKLPGSIKQFNVTTEGRVKDSDLCCLKKLKLKINTKVIFIANLNDSEDENLSCKAFNGESGVVTGFEQERILVQTSTGIQHVKKFTWTINEYVVEEEDKKKIVKIQTIGSYTQYPLKPAYAVTVHKSQGMTYDKVNVQGRIESFFTTGQLYVALSRCRNLKTLFLNLGLTADKEEKICLADPEVLKFYTDIGEKCNEVTLCTQKSADTELRINPASGSNKIQDEEILSCNNTEEISKTEPKKDNKTKFVSMRLNSYFHSYLEKICNDLNLSKTDVFSILLKVNMKENVLQKYLKQL